MIRVIELTDPALDHILAVPKAVTYITPLIVEKVAL
jgi:hypothetical protein